MLKKFYELEEELDEELAKINQLKIEVIKNCFKVSSVILNCTLFSIAYALLQNAKLEKALEVHVLSKLFLLNIKLISCFLLCLELQ